MNLTRYLDKFTPFLIFVGSLFLFTVGLRSQEIIGFESRFYLFALEMWRHGPTWFPTTYHQPYPDYPAVSTILIYGCAKMLGGMNKLAAVLPSAIAASLTVVLTYQLGALHHKRWGWFAVFFLMLTFLFFKYARSISLDMYAALFTTACFYSCYSADLKNEFHQRKRVYFLFLLGFLFRGPIGLVMPAGVVCTYYLANGSLKQFVAKGVMAALLLVFGCAVLFTVAYQVGGRGFMEDVIRMEVMGRMDKNSVTPFYYFTDSMGGYALAFPCAVLVTLGLCFAWIRRQTIPHAAFLKNLIVWIVVIMLGMSIPGDKKLRYILPMVPAAALLAAALFAVPFSQSVFHFMRRQLLRLFLYLPALFGLAVEAVYVYAHKGFINFPVHYTGVFICLAILQLVNFGCLYRAAVTHRVHEVCIVLMAVFSFIVTYLFVIEPLTLYRERARDLVVALEKQRLQQNALLVFYKEGQDGLPIKYLVNTPQETMPVFVSDPQSLLDYTLPTFFVTSEKNFTALPAPIADRFRIVASDTLGHVRVVVFTR